REGSSQSAHGEIRTDDRPIRTLKDYQVVIPGREPGIQKLGMTTERLSAVCHGRRKPTWENYMHKMLIEVSAFALALGMSAAQAQTRLKIGLIMPYSGQFADTATQMDNGIKLYMKQHGDTVAGRKIEIIRKDTGGVAPDVAKRLAQEMVVRDG